VSRANLFNRVCTGVLIAFALVWLVPLAWAVDTAFKSDAEITANPDTWAVHHFGLGAYRQVINVGDIGKWYANSLVASTLTMVLTVLFGSLAGFGLSQVRFRGREGLFWFLMAGIMIPPQVLMIPQFLEFEKTGMLNTYWSVALPQVPNAIAVFVFKQFFDGIPRELVDAARADGATWLRVYWQVFMPLCRPAVSAVAIFSFVWSWNNFLWPLLVLTSTRMMTIPVGLATTQSSYGIRYAELMASAVLGGLPLIALFLFFQRRIVEGIAGTGLK